MNNNFVKLWSPSRHQSIDESMVLFKGRHSIKQYNLMKPIKRGYKLWCRAEMSGYLSEFQVYQGKTESKSSDSQSLGLGGRVVMDLSEKIHNKNHVLWFDNFFSGVELLEKLGSEGTHACGTIRSNRKGLPNLKIDKSMKRGNLIIPQVTQDCVISSGKTTNRCICCQIFMEQKPRLLKEQKRMEQRLIFLARKP